MIRIPLLNSNDIFTYQADGTYLVYAPLSGCAALCDTDELTMLENKLATGDIQESLTTLLERLQPVLDPQDTESITEMTILLNQVCNFSCSYCYSARGRDKSVLNRETLLHAIDMFVVPTRGSKLSLTFSGGGDPMLSFDLLSEAVNHARLLSQQRGIRLDIGVVTNGSMLNDERITFIRNNNLQLVVSCDILPDVHNAQRSHYYVVASTIDRLCEEGLAVGLRSTITPLNVSRMEEMVNILHNRFPKVHSAAFEAVLNPSLFADIYALRKFYREFTKHIFATIDHGRALGIEIGNTIINNVSVCKTRSCLGKLVLTPHRSLTACSRISSPTDAHYQDFVFGNIDSQGEIHIDYDKYNAIMQSAHSHLGECQSCIAKYHCSGGCLLARKMLNHEQLQAYCEFNREMVARKIINDCF